MRTAAIYTTYFPDGDLRTRMLPVTRHCEKTIVFDNTPGGHRFVRDEMKDVVFLQDGRNKGLGAALNLGIEEARRLGCQAAVLFDQDSGPSSEFVGSILAALRSSGSRAIVAPVLVDDENPDDLRLRKTGKPMLSDASELETSGMCFMLDELSREDRFTEDFFLDLVDYDWCWKLLASGWKVRRVDSLCMAHRFGNRQDTFLGCPYHVYEPIRHYFQFRDTLKLVVHPHAPWRSRVRLVSNLPAMLLLHPLLLDRGPERLRWMPAGIRDAARGVSGIGAACHELGAKAERMHLRESGR